MPTTSRPSQSPSSHGSSSQRQSPPVVMAFGALDPAGGAGIQADIETAASLGCHCSPIATALCATGDPESVATVAVDSTVVIEQARSVLEKMPVAAIKIGFAGSVANIEVIHSILRDYPHIPVVLHPALNLWDQEDTDQAGLLNAMSELLLPLASVTNLYLGELRELTTEADTLDASAQAIINRGSEYALVCGTGGDEHHYQNSLYRAQGLIKHYQWQQLPPNCRSSASTLASSIAAYLAHNSHPTAAIEHGQNYTWQALVASRRLGPGPAVPHRFFWADREATAAGDPPADHSTH